MRYIGFAIAVLSMGCAINVSSPPPVGCGDGHVAEGEQCDLGTGNGVCGECSTSCTALGSAVHPSGVGPELSPGPEGCVEAWYSIDSSANGTYRLVGGFVSIDIDIAPTGSRLRAGIRAGAVTVNNVYADVPGAGAGWSHVAVCYAISGTHVVAQAFSDGKHVAEERTPLEEVSFGSYSLSIGTPAQAFPGKVDEVRISSRRRYVGDWKSAPAPFVPATRHELDAQTVSLFHLDYTAADAAGGAALVGTFEWAPNKGFGALCK